MTTRRFLLSSPLLLFTNVLSISLLFQSQRGAVQKSTNLASLRVNNSTRSTLAGAADDASSTTTSSSILSTAAQSTYSNDINNNNNLLSLRNYTGSWIGNTWIPPPTWKLYSQQEFQQFYKSKSVLWVGDSTARRTAMTLYQVLNASGTSHNNNIVPFEDPDVLEVNKMRITERCNSYPNLPGNPMSMQHVCRPMPAGGDTDNGKVFMHYSAMCTGKLETFVQDEVSGKSNLTTNFDIMVISLGIWEQVRDCQHSISLFDTMNKTITALMRLPITVIWRTSGYKDEEPNRDFIDRMNEHAIALCEENGMLYVNYAGAVEPRSFSPHRIKGDLKVHYGFEARMVLMQMVTNVLQTHAHYL